MSTASAYKVHVKLGQAEFSAEGPEGTVKQQLADFLLLAQPRQRSPHHSQGPQWQRPFQRQRTHENRRRRQ